MWQNKVWNGGVAKPEARSAGKRESTVRNRICAVVAVGMILGLTGPAYGHKVVAAVFSSGNQIEGEIGFSNGDMAAGATVTVWDEVGNRLGEVQTNGEGVFIFRPERRITHVFRADLGSGHVAEARLEREELPASFDQQDTGGESASSPASLPSGPAPEATLVSGATRELLAEVIRREVRPLRQELAAYKEKNDFQAVLGGIGYICGLFGIGFYLAARRQFRSL